MQNPDLNQTSMNNANTNPKGIDSGKRSYQPDHAGRKMKVMRWLDHWLGLPLCFFLGLLVTAIKKTGITRSRDITGERALAVFKFFGLGSIIEATPMLRAIRQHYPQARLIFVTFQDNERLVRKLNICTDLRIIRTDSPIHFVVDVLHQVTWLYSQRVEAVIDLEFFSKFSTLLSFFSRARVRVGFHLNDFWRYSLITHPIYFNYYHHITDVYRQAAKQLGIEIVDTQLSRFDTDDKTRQSVQQFLEQNGWTEETLLLGVNINAGDFCKERCWPVDRFARLCQTLLDKHPDMMIILTGAPSERDYVLSLTNLLPSSVKDRAIVSAGQWTLDQFIAALSFFQGFVTNDSGPMHFAASQGVPMVSIWGPGRPAFYAPQVEHHHILYSDYPCSPCLYMFTTFEAMWCKHQAWCMQAIEVETVLQATEAMLVESSNR